MWIQGQRVLRQPNGFVLEKHVHLHRPFGYGVSHPKHFASVCLRRWGTSPQARKYANSPTDGKCWLTLCDENSSRSATIFLDLSCATGRTPSYNRQFHYVAMAVEPLPFRFNRYLERHSARTKPPIRWRLFALFSVHSFCNPLFFLDRFNLPADNALRRRALYGDHCRAGSTVSHRRLIRIIP